MGSEVNRRGFRVVGVMQDGGGTWSFWQIISFQLQLRAVKGFGLEL
jgi:hypothetical protein